MKTGLAVISLLLQAAYALGVFMVVQYFLHMSSFDWTVFDADPQILAIEQMRLLIDFGLLALAGGLGYFLAWFELRFEHFRPPWYLAANRAYALLWSIFVPIGTVMAFYMRRWCRTNEDALKIT